MKGWALWGVAVWALTSVPPPKELPLRQPSVRTVYPLGGQAGATALVEIEGDFLDRAAAVRCDCPDVRGTVKSATLNRVEASVQIDAGAAPGPRVLYVDSPRGTSSRFLFRVTRWASVREAEPNDQQKTAHFVPLPAVIEGRVARLTDTDFFRFHARAGERLAFNVMTARSKAPGFVSVTLLSSTGEELAHNNARLGPDPYFEHTFGADGDYLVALTARRFADFFTVVKDDQVINWQYQLAIGRSPMLWSLFPAGGRRGTRVDAELRADFVPDSAQPLITGAGVRLAMSPIPDDCRCRHKLSIDIAPGAPLGTHYLSVPDDSGNTMYLGFVVGDEPELVEDGANPRHVELPVTINGRVNAAAEQDRYRIKVNQDDKVTIDLEARGLGGGMTDPQIALVRAQGDIVRFADDRCDGCPGALLPVLRKEFLDPKFTHAFISKAANDADAAGEYDVIVFDNSAHGGPDQIYRVSIRNEHPGFLAAAPTDHVNAKADGATNIPVAIAREEGFLGPVEIRAAGLPEGWSAAPATIPEGQDSAQLEIRRTSGPDRAALRIEARAAIDRKEVVREALVPPVILEDGAGYLELPRTAVHVAFVPPPPFVIRVEEPATGYEIELTTMPSVEFPVLIDRAPGYDAAVALSIEGLPEGVSWAADGAKVVLTADPKKAKSGRYRFLVRAEGGGSLDFVSALRLQVK